MALWDLTIILKELRPPVAHRLVIPAYHHASKLCSLCVSLVQLFCELETQEQTERNFVVPVEVRNPMVTNSLNHM